MPPGNMNMHKFSEGGIGTIGILLNHPLRDASQISMLYGRLSQNGVQEFDNGAS
jgi:hypothetical protein